MTRPYVWLLPFPFTSPGIPVTTKENHRRYCVSLHRQAADMYMDSLPVVFENADSLLLRLIADKNLYSFFAGTDPDHLTLIGTGRTQLLSTEAMPCTFTGCFVGMFAEGDAEATFRYFTAEEK